MKCLAILHDDPECQMGWISLSVCMHDSIIGPWSRDWFRHTKASWQWLDHVLQLSNLQSFPESVIGALAFGIQIKAAKKTITGALSLQLLSGFLQIKTSALCVTWQAVQMDWAGLGRFLGCSIFSCPTAPTTGRLCNAACHPLMANTYRMEPLNRTGSCRMMESRDRSVCRGNLLMSIPSITILPVSKNTQNTWGNCTKHVIHRLQVERWNSPSGLICRWWDTVSVSSQPCQTHGEGERI